MTKQRETAFEYVQRVANWMESAGTSLVDDLPTVAAVFEFAELLDFCKCETAADVLEFGDELGQEQREAWDRFVFGYRLKWRNFGTATRSGEELLIGRVCPECRATLIQYEPGFVACSNIGAPDGRGKVSRPCAFVEDTRADAFREFGDRFEAPEPLQVDAVRVPFAVKATTKKAMEAYKAAERTGNRTPDEIAAEFTRTGAVFMTPEETAMFYASQQSEEPGNRSRLFWLIVAGFLCFFAGGIIL
jgi:hypothetical protein